MTISFEEVNDSDGTGTSRTVTLAGSPSEGELIVSMCNVNGTGFTITHDQSHTQLVQADNTAGGESHRYAVFYKIAGASEPSSYSVSWVTTSRESELYVAVFSTTNSFNASTVEDAAFSSQATSDATAECPSITVADESVALCFSALDTSTATYSSVDNSYTRMKASSGARYIEPHYRIFSTGQSTGVTTITWADAEQAINGHWSFKEDPDAGTTIEVPTGPWR